jgi:hypothetical protein
VTFGQSKVRDLRRRPLANRKDRARHDSRVPMLHRDHVAIHLQMGTHVLTGVRSVHIHSCEQTVIRTHGRRTKRRATFLFLPTIVYCRAVRRRAGSKSVRHSLIQAQRRHPLLGVERKWQFS